MKQDEVPQHHAPTFMGHGKVLYALDESGRYTLVASDGWEAEEIVLDQAIVEFERRAAEALARARAGQGSALEVHMYQCRMDPSVLAQATGFFLWQVRRHLRGAAFEALAQEKQARYAEALGVPIEELKRLPEGE
jgi:hypothetical protein